MISGISNGGILSLFFHVLIEGIIATFACIKERNEKPQKQLPSAECNQKLLHLLKYGGSKQLITVPRKNAAVAAWFKLRDKDAENYLFEHVGERTWSKVLDAHTKGKLRKVFKKGLNEANGVRGIRDNLLKASPQLTYPDRCNSGYSPRNFTQSTDCRERSFNGRSFFAQDSEG